MLDGNGNITGTYDTAPFGSTIAVTGVDTRKQFIDKENDEETSTANHGVRQYDPKTGRFPSIDPLWEKFPSQSPYHYSFNNPVVLADGNGKNPTGGGFAIGAGIAEAAITATLTTLGIASAESIDRTLNGPNIDESLVFNKGDVDYFLGIGPAMQLSNGKTMTVPLKAQISEDVAWGTVFFAIAADGGGIDEAPEEPEPLSPASVPPIPANPADAPGPEWVWKGNGDPGSAQGNWYNEGTREKLHPELGPNRHGPHWDYQDSEKRNWRIYPDGSTERKMRRGKPQ